MWILIAGATALLLALFYDGLKPLVESWSNRPEYSHGFALPFIAAFLVWQKKHLLETLPFEGSWTGFLVLLAGVALYFAGELSTLYIIVQYSFVLVLAGLILALMGWRAFKTVCVPLLILFLTAH